MIACSDEDESYMKQLEFVRKIMKFEWKNINENNWNRNIKLPQIGDIQKVLDYLKEEEEKQMDKDKLTEKDRKDLADDVAK